MKIDEEIKARFSSPQQRALVNLRYTSNMLGTIQNAFMVDFGLTMPQFNILRILRGAGEEIPVSVVKKRMIEKSPNTTRLMDKLIDKGLISRKRCSEDRRVVYVEITKAGLELLDVIDVKLDENEKLFLPNKLSDEEANTLSDLLDKFRSNVCG